MENMRTLRIAVGLIMGLVLVTGCASRQVQVAEVMDHEHAGSSASWAGVAVVESGGGLKLKSGLRYSGERSRRLTWEQTLLAVEGRAGNTTFRVLYPAHQADQMAGLSGTPQTDFARVADLAAQVADRFVRNMQHMDGRKIDLDVFTAFDSGGYLLEAESDLRSGPLRVLSVMPSIADAYTLEWWVVALSGALHELVHVNHRLQLSDPAREKLSDDELTNQETAASIVELCANLEFVSAANANGDDQTFELDWSALDLPEAFPGLRDGHFKPDMQRLREVWPHPTNQGKSLASAAMYRFSENGSIDFGDAQTNDRRQAYCNHVLNHVPDFVAGELR